MTARITEQKGKMIVGKGIVIYINVLQRTTKASNKYRFSNHKVIGKQADLFLPFVTHLLSTKVTNKISTKTDYQVSAVFIRCLLFIC